MLRLKNMKKFGNIEIPKQKIESKNIKLPDDILPN